MQNLTRSNMVVIEDYEYMKKKWNENVKWRKPTHVLSIVLLNVKVPFGHLPLLHKT